MSKHKRFHGFHNTRQQAKAYAFMHRTYPYGSVRGVQLKKKIAASVTSTDGGKVEQILNVSTSNDTKK